MERALYDTKAGIASQLTSLEGLNAVIDARQEAGYGLNKRLRQYVIMGRWLTDTCGNFMQATEAGIPKELCPDIPDVLTDREFWKYMQKNGDPEKVRQGFAWSMGHTVPPVKVLCAECQQTWTLQNCHDSVSKSEDVVASLAPFVGKPFDAVRKYYASLTDAVYFIQPDLPLRNDRFIDLTPDEKYPSLVKNERGWVRKIADDYVVEEGDEALVVAWKYFHKPCNRTFMARREESYFQDVFAKAGFAPDGLKLTSTHNEYCSCENCAPWYNVETPDGTIKVGWRKRVIEIDWRQLREGNFSSLFRKEKVTKGSHSIHAWGTDKAIEYLQAINRALQAAASK